MLQIRYQKISRNRYRLFRRFSIRTPIHPEHPIVTKFYSLNTNGFLMIFPGYVWNGGNWPAIDTLNMIYASLLHDVMCQMLHAGELSWAWRVTINKYFVSILKEVGTYIINSGKLKKLRSKILDKRCKWVYKAVDKLGPNMRRPVDPLPVLVIPETI